MPLMTQIRNNLAKLFAVFAVIFIAYIMLDWGMELTSLRPGGAGDTVGEVNGEKITYRQFSEILRRALEGQRSQTGQEVDPETERQVRSQVWNTLVTQMLIEEEIQRLGITVTNQEIVDLVHGPNPPEDLISMFRDSTGAFNRAAYDRAIADPQNRQAWLEVEERLRQQIRQQKLQSLLFATVGVSEEEVRQRFRDRTITIEAEYALFDPAALVPDSMVVVTEEDITRYYRDHQEGYKVRPARKLSAVIFATAPSEQDTQDVVLEIQRLKEQAKTEEEFLRLAGTYSEIPATKAYYKAGELSREKATAAFTARVGDVVGPVKDFDGIHLLRITNSRRGKEEFVRAAHILFGFGTDTVDALGKARDVMRRIRAGEDFAEMARQHGSDGTAPEGGDLGWGSKTTWVKPFADAAFGAKTGDVVGPIRSQFGYHLIKVLGRTNQEVELIDLVMRVKASGRSIDEAYQKAEDFAYLAQDEGFERAAQNSSYQIREIPEFSEGGSIPQIGFNDAVMKFAFSSSIDDVSNAISVTGGVGVFKLVSIREEGVRPLEDVKNLVRSLTLRTLKMKKLLDRVNAFHATLASSGKLVVAAQSQAGVVARATGPFKAMDAVQGIGRDLSFIGMAQSMDVGQTSRPFEGVRGYFILQLTSKTPFDSTLYASQRADLREQILQEKRNRFSQDWVANLREQADIEDHRDRFFR
ncbi:MAG: peptidylprolyl isomerase [Bacteroidota bacterium]